MLTSGNCECASLCTKVNGGMMQAHWFMLVLTPMIGTIKERRSNGHGGACL